MAVNHCSLSRNNDRSKSTFGTCKNTYSYSRRLWSMFRDDKYFINCEVHPNYNGVPPIFCFNNVGGMEFVQKPKKVRKIQKKPELSNLETRFL